MLCLNGLGKGSSQKTLTKDLTKMTLTNLWPNDIGQCFSQVAFFSKGRSAGSGGLALANNLPFSRLL